MVMAQNTTMLVNVGVVLDLEHLAGKKGLSCIKMALSDFYATNSHYKPRLVRHTRNSMEDVVGAAAAALINSNFSFESPFRNTALTLIKNVELQAIIGPTTSTQAGFVIELGQKAHAPIISFSASTPSLASIRRTYLFRATKNDSTQVGAIAALIQAFGWREAVPIYVDNEYGQGVIPYLTDSLQAIDTRIPYRSLISFSATDDQIAEELYKLMSMQTRVFILHMLPSLGSRLLTKSKRANSCKITQELSMLSRAFTNYGHMMLLLHLAIDKAGAAKIDFQKANTSSNSTIDLTTFGVSLNGPDLLQALSNTGFRGLAGDFLFVNEQLPSSTFQIINVIGDGARGLGFWTPQKGLIKKLNSVAVTNLYSTSESNLAPVIWPGDSSSILKGWEIPTKGKKLRILVPVKEGFSEFVKVTRDPRTNTTTVRGNCIDVVNAVSMSRRAVFNRRRRRGRLQQNPTPFLGFLYLQMGFIFAKQKLLPFTAEVGDTAIIANKSLYVDFIFLYTESGESMIVPIKDNNRERVVSNLARLVVMIWCFVILILTQSYTTSLTSLLTVQQLMPTVTDVHQLINNGEYVGYQEDSFVLGILRGLGFHESKLKVYNSTKECNELFVKGTENGSIAAALRKYYTRSCS
ncbi:glutamate receptor 2 plant, putative [Ricinus communis]|uniref:Glutamate receptor 2 plant, putative n=1 Tax=Ricinus communis TaxID=3988 RepID=B9RNQ7_RICCO|nr:glutamate receptor 2 plant, putative [Ricinus communis]